MDAITYRSYRQAVGSWETVAALLGVHWRTIARRESGEIPITAEAAVAIQALPATWYRSQPPLPELSGITLRPVPDHPGYAASTDGRVFSCHSRCPNRQFPFTDWSELRPTQGVRGYWVISLRGLRGRRQYKLHQLILTTFVGPKPPGQCGRHLNDNRDDNHLDNLAWGTFSENCHDMYRNGHNPDRRGIRHPMAKLTDDDIRRIRQLRTQGQTLRTIGDQYKITEALVCKITKRRNWTHVT